MARGKRYQPEQVVNLLRQIEVAVADGKGSDRTSTSSAYSVSCRDVDHVMQRIAIIGAQALFLCILAGPCRQRSVEVGIHALGLTLRQAFCRA